MANQVKTILILGATGRTGRWLVSEALALGHAVHALVRNPQSLQEFTCDRLSVFEGSPINAEDLDRAATGCNTVISALNISRTSDFPWAKLRTPTDFLSGTMKQLILLAERVPFKKIIVISAWGAGDSLPEIPFWFRWLVQHSNIGFAYADHERQELLLQNFSLNYTILRPSGLTNGIKDKPVIVSRRGVPEPSLTISRKNLAKFALSLLNGEFTREVLTVSC